MSSSSRRRSSSAEDEEGIELQPLVARPAPVQGLHDGAQQAPAPAPGPAPAQARDELRSVARDLVEGVRDIQDLAGELSEGQVAALEAMRSSLDNLRAMSRMLEQVAADREAVAELLLDLEIGPPVPLEEFLAMAPALNLPALQGAGELNALRATIVRLQSRAIAPFAAAVLRERLGGSILPAARVRNAVRSGDDHVAQVVSVNVFPGDASADGRANFGADNRAGGALPIAIERHGDAPQEPDREMLAELEQRATESAVLIIDPDRLSMGDRARVLQSAGGGGGESGLDEVPPQAVVAVLVPVVMADLFSADEIARHHMLFVGDVVRGVYHNGSGQTVPIAHPDYRTALHAIFARHRGKVLVTHTTRLSAPGGRKKGGGGSRPPEHEEFKESKRSDRDDHDAGAGSSGSLGLV